MPAGFAGRRFFISGCGAVALVGRGLEKRGVMATHTAQNMVKTADAATEFSAGAASSTHSTIQSNKIKRRRSLGANTIHDHRPTLSTFTIKATCASSLYALLTSGCDDDLSVLTSRYDQGGGAVRTSQEEGPWRGERSQSAAPLTHPPSIKNLHNRPLGLSSVEGLCVRSPARERFRQLHDAESEVRTLETRSSRGANRVIDYDASNDCITSR